MSKTVSLFKFSGDECRVYLDPERQEPPITLPRQDGHDFGMALIDYIETPDSSAKYGKWEIAQGEDGIVTAKYEGRPSQLSIASNHIDDLATDYCEEIDFDPAGLMQPDVDRVLAFYRDTEGEPLRTAEGNVDADAFAVCPGFLEMLRKDIAKLRVEYLESPTYYEVLDRRGIACARDLAEKEVHRDWWNEYTEEFAYSGSFLRTYYDDILDMVVETCAEELEVQSSHERLLEEDDTWYDPDDPYSHQWDERLCCNSTGSTRIDRYAVDLTKRLLEEFAIAGAAEFSRVELNKVVALEEQLEEYTRATA